MLDKFGRSYVWLGVVGGSIVGMALLALAVLVLSSHSAAEELSVEEPSKVEEQQKYPVPSDAVQSKIALQVSNLYKLGEAKTATEKLRHVRQLSELAKKTGENPEEQYVLLWTVMELAGEAGDAVLMLRLIDAIEVWFDVDALDIKQEALAEFAIRGTDTPRTKSLLKATRHATNQAVAENRYEVAMNLAKLAYRTGQRSQNRALRKETRDRRQWVQNLRDEWRQFQRSQVLLKASPENGQASLVLGRWYCFVKDDWQQGLPHLAKSSDQGLASLAKREVDSPPKSPEDQLAMADAWWELAQTRKGEEKVMLMLRAGHWYDQCCGALASGMGRLKARKRLEEITGITHPHAAAQSHPAKNRQAK